MAHVVALNAKRWNVEIKGLLKLKKGLGSCIVVARPTESIAAELFSSIPLRHLNQTLLQSSLRLRQSHPGCAPALQPGSQSVRILRLGSSGHDRGNDRCGVPIEIPQDDRR